MDINLKCCRNCKRNKQDNKDAVACSLGFVMRPWMGRKCEDYQPTAQLSLFAGKAP